MTTSDPLGNLPPHELRGLLATVTSRDELTGAPRAPGPSLATGGSPGLATAAATPAPLTPTLPADDPGAIALAISRIAGEQFGGASTIPVPLVPEHIASGSGWAPHAVQSSPGIAPQLVAAGPTQPSQPSTPSPPELADPSAVVWMPLVASGSEAPSFGGLDVTSMILPDELMQLPLLDLEPANPRSASDDTFPAESTRYWMPDATPPAPSPAVDAVPQPSGGTAFDPYLVRRDFPILEERVHGGKRLVWLDNAATTQKPRSVIDRLTYFYEHENSNVHRAAHALAARATDAYEGARETTRKFVNASSTSEIIFVRGATEGINLIAKSWGRRNVEAGDEIVLTHLEHHANIVPWQQLCAETGARLRVAPVDDRGDVILDAFERLMCSRTKLVAFTQVSNALGTVTPAREMIEIAHRWGATVVLDGAQAVSHMPVDVQRLDCDFFVFSGHKVFAPTGIGAVFGKRALLDAMPPWQGGGNMIQDVTFERTVYQPPPWRFEAGTGNIADAAGMAAALDYVMRIGMPTIERYEHELLGYAIAQLATVPGLHRIGTPREQAGVVSFVLDGQRTEEVGAALDQEGIAVRSGHHCAQPILRRFGVESSIRASLAFYNVREDIDALVRALTRLQAGPGAVR